MPTSSRSWPSGSSPRERGTRSCFRIICACLRFIPARAGNTQWWSRRRSKRSVHPRASGEHAVADFVEKHDHGSSPRERGTRRRARNSDGVRRFIPARAGNTHSHSYSWRHRSVHPRASGEHERSLPVPLTNAGSSPRERGTPGQPLAATGLVRFIPARAGNTPQCADPGARLPVHPRASGEHGAHRVDHRPYDGSSPRERGTLRHGAEGVGIRRFIPARAGNTFRQCEVLFRIAVHPRASGEHPNEHEAPFSSPQCMNQWRYAGTPAGCVRVS